MTGQQLIDAAELSPEGHTFIRVRDPKWANPDAYLRLSVLRNGNGQRSIGPWAHLFDRRTQEAIGEPTPQQMLTIGRVFDSQAFLMEDFEGWTGSLDPADK